MRWVLQGIVSAYLILLLAAALLTALGLDRNAGLAWFNQIPGVGKYAEADQTVGPRNDLERPFGGRGALTVSDPAAGPAQEQRRRAAHAASSPES